MLSFWERESFLEYDYIIIGSGIVGLSATASILERDPKARVCICERGLMPAGASTRNAGFACFGSPTELHDQRNKEGLESTLELVEARWKGLLKLRQRLGDKAIGYEGHGGYELLREQELWALDALNEYNEHLQPIFGGAVYFDRTDQLPELGFDGGVVRGLIYSPFEGQIHSGMMMKSLIRYVTERGGQVLTGAKVTGLDEGSGGVCVNLEESAPGRSMSLKAKQVILCTNAFARELMPELDVVPGRGQVIVTKPIDELPFKGVFHFDEGYYYFRNVGNRVLFGGGRNLDFEGEQTTEFAPNQRILTKLEDLLRDMILPGREFEIEMQWSGIMAFGPERYPIVKRITPGLVAGVRMHGMGVAIGSLVGERLAELVFEAH
jgi:glycine/D-amino acid oxidase-like deaminating enzyme